MNWKQVYATATPGERRQIAIMLLRRIQARSPMPALRYHFIGMQHKNKNVQVVYLSLFIFILSTVSLAMWLVSLHISPAYGAPLVFSWNAVLAIILLIRPVRRIHRI